MNKKFKSLSKNTLIFGVSSFGTKALSFLLVPLYTSILTTTDYGIADLITTTSMLLIFVLTINISSSVLRFTLEKKDLGKNILSYGFRIVMISTIICTVIMIMLYISDLFSWPSYYFSFVVLYFFSNALYELMTNYLRALDKITEVAVTGILSTAIIIISNVIFLLFLRLGIIGYLLSMVLGPFCSSIVCMLYAKAPLVTYLKVDCPRFIRKQMIIYCIPLIFNNIALWINAFMDRYFVTYYCGASSNGIYSVASKIPTILSTFYSIFSSAWTLSAIVEFDPEDRDGFFSQTYKIYAAMMSIICSVIILFNIPLANFLYAKDFFIAWKYSSVLLLSVLFNTLTVFQGSIFSAAKRTGIVANTTLISASINLILNILFIPKYGILGAAVSTAFSYFCMWIIRYFYLKNIISMKVNLIRDFITYILLCIQIVFEHTKNHSYIGQIICLIVIISIYFKNILFFCKKIVMR